MITQLKTKPDLQELEDWTFNVFDNLESNNHYAIHYSGGKDSSALLGLYLKWLDNKAIAALPNISVIFNDTLLESKKLYQLIDDMGKVLASKNIEFNITQPAIDRTYWAIQFGIGYPVPNHKNRWCTGDLKVKPSQRFYKQREGAIPITGTHLGESHKRNQRLSKCGSTECGIDMVKEKVNTINPIAKWDNCDVWDWLIINSDEYLYKDFFSQLESAYTDTKSEESNGSLRMGCAFCPVVAVKTLENNVNNRVSKPYVIEIRKILEKLRKAPRINSPKTGNKGAIKVEYRKIYWGQIERYFSQLKEDGFIDDEIIAYVDKKLASDSYPPTYPKEWIKEQEELLESQYKQLSLF